MCRNGGLWSIDLGVVASSLPILFVSFIIIILVCILPIGNICTLIIAAGFMKIITQKLFVHSMDAGKL